MGSVGAGKKRGPKPYAAIENAGGPRPEPTIDTDTGYDTYMWPRSKTYAKDQLYQYLHLQGWRFDLRTGEWHTPERLTRQAHGRLSHDADLSEGGKAWITPPTDPNGLKGAFGLPILPKPILVLRWQRFVQGWGWIIEEDRT